MNSSWLIMLLGSAVVGAKSLERPSPSNLSVTVDLSKSQLEIRIGDKLAGRYPVSVGKPEFRTPLGEYHLSQVIWNPTWVPPQEKWAEHQTPKGPKEPGNPMGRVKILFAPELYIHGTTAIGALGDPVSHGCIRMSNRSAIGLARLVMQYGGAPKPRAWYSKVQAEKTPVEVELPNPPTLRIVE